MKQNLLKQNLRSVLFLSAALLAAGCSSSDKDNDEEGDHASGATCPTATASTLTYDNFGSAFFASYCLLCHSSSKTGAARQSAPTDQNFDTLADIKMHAASIDIEAAASPSRTNTSMPPAGTAKIPTSNERMQLGEWLACGAP